MSDKPGGDMMFRNIFIKLVFSFLLISTFSNCLAQPSDGQLKAEGVRFRAKIQVVFEKMQHEDAQRIYELTSECKRLNLTGRPVTEVNKVLRAAGQKFDLIKESSPTAGSGDLVGGIVLAKGTLYSAVFNIVLVAPLPRKGGERNVEAVKLCNVLSNSL